MIEALVVVGWAAVVAFAMQVMGAISALVDVAGVRDADEPDAVTRTRLRELVWAFAVLAVVAVFIAFGVDWAARLVWDRGEPFAGAGVLVLTATAAFVAGSIGVIVIARRERPTYARLRRDLRDRSPFTLKPEELADFDARLERADILTARRPRVDLAAMIVGLVLVLGAALVLAAVAVDSGSPLGWIVAAAVAIEVAAFVIALRARAVYRARLAVVLAAQRADVVALLERARIPQSARVPGLRDRVSRALAILREKQR